MPALARWPDRPGTRQPRHRREPRQPYLLPAEAPAELAAVQRAAGGLLVVDKAFVDADPDLPSALPLVPGEGVEVPPSLGKSTGWQGCASASRWRRSP